eukprot:gene719-783_t
MLPFPAYSNNGLYRISSAYPAKRRHRWFLVDPFLSPEFRLFSYVVTLYAVFISWGYLQEKIASNVYSLPQGSEAIPNRWDYPIVLNALLSLSCFLTAAVVDRALESRQQPVERKRDISFFSFWKVAITSALASPIGYASLKYISFPMMVLSKSSKHVPVMLVGKVLYSKNYAWYKYVSVALVCGGISMFTLAKSSSGHSAKASTDEAGLLATIWGLFLIFVNLSLDGVTSNEQDHLFAKQGATSLQMMKSTNIWQTFYLTFFLLAEYLLWGKSSALFRSSSLIWNCSELQMDLLGFCLCGCVGQVLLLGLIREFGSLVWITVSVTRQLFTILLSVFLFQHPVNIVQWTAVAVVFGGLAFEIVFAYRNKPASKKSDKPSSPTAVNTIPCEDLSSVRHSESEDSTWDDSEEPGMMISPFITPHKKML